MLPGEPRRHIEPVNFRTPDADGGPTRRRDFITLIAASAFVWPHALRAQQKALPVIGYLNGSTPEAHAVQLAAFRQGLSETGWVERQNLKIEYRWAGFHYDRLPG